MVAPVYTQVNAYDKPWKKLQTKNWIWTTISVKSFDVNTPMAFQGVSTVDVYIPKNDVFYSIYDQDYGQKVCINFELGGPHHFYSNSDGTK